MDKKTLEYMEERAKKARILVNKIESLLKCSEKVADISEVQFSDRNGSNKFHLSNRHSDPRYNHSRLIQKIRPSIEALIADEIALLESELAEL